MSADDCPRIDSMTWDNDQGFGAVVVELSPGTLQEFHALPDVEDATGQVLDVMVSHQPGRRNKDGYGFWRKHCAGCRWAGSPWEDRAKADAEHREHVAREVLVALGLVAR